MVPSARIEEQILEPKEPKKKLMRYRPPAETCEMDSFLQLATPTSACLLCYMHPEVSALSSILNCVLHTAQQLYCRFSDSECCGSRGSMYLRMRPVFYVV